MRACRFSWVGPGGEISKGQGGGATATRLCDCMRLLQGYHMRLLQGYRIKFVALSRLPRRCLATKREWPLHHRNKLDLLIRRHVGALPHNFY